MKNFVVLYYSNKEAMTQMRTSSPEEMQAGQKEWMEWFKKLGDDLVDRGEFFGKGTSFTVGGSEDATGKVTGYSIIQAESMADASELVKNHPHLNWHEGCSVEVYEPMQMGH